MKQFINQLSAFVIIAVFLFLSIGVSLKRRISTPCGVAPLNDSIKILAVGDSHVRYGINDTMNPIRLHNQATDGEHIFYTLSKTIFFVEQNPHIKNVIISFNPFLLGDWRKIAIDGKLGKVFYPRFFPLIQAQPQLTLDFMSQISFVDFLNCWLTVNVGFPNKKILNDLIQNKYNKETFLGGFVPIYTSNIGNVNLLSKLQEHYGTFDYKNPQDYFGVNEIKYFYKLLEYLKNKGVKIILCNTPCHYDYNVKIPRFITNYMDSIALGVVQNYNAQYLNYQYTLLPDSCFSDYDHLNAYGAEWFTREILNQIVL